MSGAEWDHGQAMTMPMYTITVTRDADLWAAQVGGLPAGCVGATDVQHAADLDVEVRDLVAGLTDTTPDAFDLDWRYVQTAATTRRPSPTER